MIRIAEPPDNSASAPDSVRYDDASERNTDHNVTRTGDMVGVIASESVPA